MKSYADALMLSQIHGCKVGELKPCPWCGERAITAVREDGLEYCQCNQCGARGPVTLQPGGTASTNTLGLWAVLEPWNSRKETEKNAND